MAHSEHRHLKRRGHEAIGRPFKLGGRGQLAEECTAEIKSEPMPSPLAATGGGDKVESKFNPNQSRPRHMQNSTFSSLGSAQSSLLHDDEGLPHDHSRSHDFNDRDWLDALKASIHKLKQQGITQAGPAHDDDDDCSMTFPDSEAASLEDTNRLSLEYLRRSSNLRRLDEDLKEERVAYGELLQRHLEIGRQLRNRETRIKGLQRAVDEEKAALENVTDQIEAMRLGKRLH